MSRKILVVEDDADTREALVALLQLENYRVVAAEDGRFGLDKAEREHPDLIITDINMPNLNGIEMTKMLRQQGEFSKVPIMVITAYGDQSIAEAVKAGADLGLTKPLDIDSLFNSIKRLLITGNG